MEKPVTNRPVGFICEPLLHDYPDHVSACYTPAKPPEKPDPAIYSQEEQLALGLEVAWDSPDITTNHFSPWRLFEEPEVKVRNLSPDTNAINVLVNFYTSLFGIGTSRHFLSAQVVNLGPQQEALLTYPLSQEIINGDQRIGVHVIIEHPYDSNRDNNRGSQVVSGAYTSEAGRQQTIQFPVVNSTANHSQINLSVLQNDVSASVTPATHYFAPWEQITATLTMLVPSFLHGAPGADLLRYVTVVGRDPGGDLVDGLTHILRIND